MPAQGREIDLDFVRLDEESFARSPNISVDYAIFEKTQLVALIPVSFPWSDLGSWDAVWKVSGKDDKQNAVLGDATLSNTTNSFVHTDKAHVALEGLDDPVVQYAGGPRVNQALAVGPDALPATLPPASQVIIQGSDPAALSAARARYPAATLTVVRDLQANPRLFILHMP